MLDECFTSTGGATIPERLRGISGASDGRRRGELWEKGHTDETEAWSQERQSGSTSAADAGAETILTFYTIAEAIKSIDDLQWWDITANSRWYIFIIIINEFTYFHRMYSIRFHCLTLRRILPNPHQTKTKGKHSLSHYLDEINHDCEGRREFTHSLKFSFILLV